MCKTKITLLQAIHHFPSALSAEGKAPSTIEAYISDLKIFIRFMKEHHPSTIYVYQLNRQQLTDYIEFLNKYTVDDKKFCRRTIDRKTDSIMKFCRYVFQYNYAQIDLLKDYDLQRIHNGFIPTESEGFNPYILRPDEIKCIFDTIRYSNSRNKSRDYTIFLMLAEFGCRRSTVLALSWEDIDYYRNEITLHHQKDKKITKVPIPQNFIDALKDYSYISNNCSGPVFLSIKENPLSTTAFNTLIKKWVIASNLDSDRITSHTFRHTFITKLINENVSGYKIIQYTGSTIEALKPYYNLKTSDLDAITKIMTVAA